MSSLSRLTTCEPTRDRMRLQDDPLRDVPLEDETEAAALVESVDLGPQIRAQGLVLDLVEEDVKLAADHVGRVVGSGALCASRPLLSCEAATSRGSSGA
jgi:hypothetical protein